MAWSLDLVCSHWHRNRVLIWWKPSTQYPWRLMNLSQHPGNQICLPHLKQWIALDGISWSLVNVAKVISYAWVNSGRLSWGCSPHSTWWDEIKYALCILSLQFFRPLPPSALWGHFSPASTSTSPPIPLVWKDKWRIAIFHWILKSLCLPPCQHN